MDAGRSGTFRPRQAPLSPEVPVSSVPSAPPQSPAPSPPAHLEHDVPVEHRWLGLDRRTIAPALGVAILALFWAVVVPAIDRAIPEDRKVEAGQVFGAGNGVTVAPPTGWNVEAPRIFVLR